MPRDPGRAVQQSLPIAFCVSNVGADDALCFSKWLSKECPSARMSRLGKQARCGKVSIPAPHHTASHGDIDYIVMHRRIVTHSSRLEDKEAVT